MIRLLGILIVAASASCLVPAAVAAEPGALPETAARPSLPPDADDRVDQTPYLDRGTYLTEAGVVAPLPDPDEDAAGDAGVPDVKRH